MAPLIPSFIMFLIIFAITGVGIYLKQYIHEKIALSLVLVCSCIVIIKMLPGALESVFLGVLENAKNSTFPF